MAISWTDEQKKAIVKDGCNLIVAAAAGSGKTAVLVEKIVNIIESGVDIDSLLITTFTDAAAKKMKQEIGDEIKKRLVNDMSNTHLSRQLILLSRADICTIDSFCMKVVRANFHLLDIDADFKIADQNESELLRIQAANEVFADLYESNNKQFYKLLDCYATQRGDDALLDIVLSIHSFVRSMPNYELWLEKCVKIYDDFVGNIFEQEWGKIILQNTKIVLEGCISCVLDALCYAKATDEMSSYVVPLEIDLRDLRDILKVLSGGCGFDDAVKKIREYKNASGGRAKPKTPDEIKQPVSDNREYVKKCMTKLANEFYYASEDEICEEISYTNNQVRALCDVVKCVENRFFEIKNKRGVLDFADIEHLALKALLSFDSDKNIIQSEAARELRDKYKMILVDEYQDSNELQEMIFKQISRGDNIFMVGDLKQSIYRFRHTNPLLFKHKKDSYSDSEGVNQRVIMSKNFRSRKGVVDFVNFIMSQNASEFVGELEYDDTESLNFGAQYPSVKDLDTATEIHIIENDMINGDDDINENVFGAEAEAIRVAKRILQLKNEGFEIFDKKEGLRPIKYKDIVILMRSPNVDAQIFSQVLTNFGIPVFSDVSGGYFMSEEVELMISLLSIIDNPIQDIKLLSVMRSVIGGFDDTELMEMRLCDKNSDIYGALCACADSDLPISKKCAQFIKKLNEWREHALYMSVHEMISYLYNDTLYYEFVGASDIGNQRRSNLNLLLEYAREYEKTSFKGLFNFVSYVERVKNASRDFGAAKMLGENQDVVRIMSIHKSKGLEFGVVFLTRLAKKFNVRDLSNPVLMHSKLGIGVDCIDTENRYKYNTFIKRAIKEKLRGELLSEELRILYVAMTRAREKLILTIAPSSRENKKKKWLSGARSEDKNALPIYYTSSATGMSDWVMGAMMRHASFREYANEHISCANANFDVKVYTSCEFAVLQSDDEKPKESILQQSSSYDDLIDKTLGYVYPYENVKNIPTKLSVTEMKRIVNDELDTQLVHLGGEHMIETPSFLSKNNTLTASQKGSATHFVMQLLDLSKSLDENDIREQIECMQRKMLITKEQAQSVSVKKIADFFRCDLGKRMTSSSHVEREAPFEVAIDASEVINCDACNEEILLQGIIDCYFYEGEEIVLVDYKTDFVKSNDDIEKIKNRYELQLRLYARALEKITNKHVKEKILYLFSCENVIKYT